MRRYSKSRQISRSATVILSPGGNQTMGDRVGKILGDNSPLSAEDWFILTQVHLICLFRRTKKESRKTKLSKYISQKEERFIGQKKYPKSGLTFQDFIGLNQWVVNQDLTHKLENLIKQVKQRKREEKRTKKIRIITSQPLAPSSSG